MLKRLLCAAMVCVSASEAGAQVEQSVSIGNATESGVDVTLRFRNTQSLSDIYNVFAITHVYAFYTGPESDQCGLVLFCNFQMPTLSWDGSADLAPFQVVPPPPFTAFPYNVNYNPYTFGFQYSNYAFGPLVFGSLQDTWGVIGCTRPRDIVGSGIFAGRNCIEEGHDGFFQFTTRFVLSPTLGIDARTLTVDQFSLSAAGFSVPLTTPEPSTYILMAAGLGALALLRRRRRSAHPM